MTVTRSNIDGIEALLDRLVAATDQITKASEKQAREVDRQLKRLIDRGEPTTERLLKAFDNIALIVIHTGDQVERHLTKLSALQKTILRLLKCPVSWYRQLEYNSG